MSKVDEVRSIFERAAEVECVASTYIPGRDGMRLAVGKVGRTVAEGTQLSGDHAGEPFHLTFPSRVRDVVAVGPDWASYLIGRDDHSVTYRIAVAK